MIRHAETKCPFCSYILDATSEVEGEDITPSEGDIALCWNCGEWMVFSEAAEGGLREPTDDEYVEIGTEPRFRAIRAAWKQVTKETH